MVIKPGIDACGWGGGRGTVTPHIGQRAYIEGVLIFMIRQKMRYTNLTNNTIIQQL